ncbi:MAG: GntR family transcriptional regulator [Rhizobiales bacterium]|nr:GntR family transcriptional regulator [Hyphomicrobiales bacterium]
MANLKDIPTAEGSTPLRTRLLQEGEPAHAPLTRKLRRDILYGRWVAGQWLKQVDLERHYDAGRSQVRAGLAEMTRLGLIVHEMNRGYRVTSPDPVVVAEMRATRSVLEASTVEGILARIKAADAAALRGLAERFAAATEGDDFELLYALNQDFHMGMYALCGNQFLADLIAELRARSLAGGTGRWNSPSGLAATAAEHLAMMDAIDAGDAARLGALIRQHVTAF